MAEEHLIRTRTALHAVAELVLAGPQHRASGTIKLRVTPGGFHTWAAPALAVVGTDLRKEGIVIAISGRTARELAAAVGVTAGAPRDVYSDGCGAEVDDELVLDADAVAQLASAWSRGDTALRRLAPDLEPVLWPEHFDVAIRVDNINYGVSPGDTYLAEPYAYVGLDAVPTDDTFWNAPFGAARAMSHFTGADSLYHYFADARDRHRARSG